MGKIFLKRLILPIILILSLAVFLMLLRGDENTWICQNGEWIRHGVPIARRPDEPCGDNKYQENDKIEGMEITSQAFDNNAKVPKEYTCDGKNVNPPLHFIDVPMETKSLVLIMDDPDAPTGTWVHWTMWNIPASLREISEGEVPEGSIEGETSFGKTGYGGPCPPSGTHRYVFKLYALDSNLDLDESALAATLEEAMKSHILVEARLVGLYR